MLRIFKRIKLNPNIVKINENDIKIDGKTYDYNKIVKFNSVAEEYPLISIVYLLINYNISHSEYVAKCIKEKIKIVNIASKEQILNEIDNFKEVCVKGIFLKPVYKIDHIYDIPVVSNINYILVSNSLINKINLNNIELFITQGHYKEPDNIMISSHVKEFTKDTVRFKAFNSFNNFTKYDWNLVKIIFIDNLENELRINCPNFTKLKTQAIFISMDVATIKNKNQYTYLLCPKIQNNCIMFYDNFWKAIMKVCN